VTSLIAVNSALAVANDVSIQNADSAQKLDGLIWKVSLEKPDQSSP